MTDEPTLRVLIVDDTPDTANTLAALVTEWGYETRVAPDGAGALKAALEFEPTVILLDLTLPDRHGYEVAKQIRKEAAGRKMFFVAVTGWAQIADQLESSAAGVSHHLIKPVNPEALKAILAGYRPVEVVQPAVNSTT